MLTVCVLVLGARALCVILRCFFVYLVVQYNYKIKLKLMAPSPQGFYSPSSRMSSRTAAHPEAPACLEEDLLATAALLLFFLLLFRQELPFSL